MRSDAISIHVVTYILLFGILLWDSVARAQNDVELTPFHHSTYSRLIPKVNELSKNKVDSLGAILKRHIEQLRQTNNKKVDIIFLVDSSASVGQSNFVDELKFVRKLLADFTVDESHTRLAVITFSSRGKVLKQIDYISSDEGDRHKCSLLEQDLPQIRYVGGGTFTLGAFLKAKEVLKSSRPDASKAIFLITDGFSNSGDPRPQARKLRESGVKIFTFGIRNGNVHELHDMASEPKNETCYILDSFEEFEQLARRALHEDLQTGSYVKQPQERCRHLCQESDRCCHVNATCRCGTHTGQFECVCRKGHYGTGLQGNCFPCPPGTYKRKAAPGDVSSCTPCPDKNHVTKPGAIYISECVCKRGFRIFNTTQCAALRCPPLIPPEDGYFVNDKCNNVFNAACGMKCNAGYKLVGSSLRICEEFGVWSGNQTECIMKTCAALPRPKNGHMICSNDAFTFSTECRFTCNDGFKLVGSRKRECLAIAQWTGIPTRCREITCQPLPEVRDGNVYPAMCTGEEVPFGTTCQIACKSGYSLVGPSRKHCTTGGMWASAMDGTMSQCEDTQPPYITCPMDIETEVGEEDSTAEVMWAVPLAVDNSGFIPLITVIPAMEPPKDFPIGLTAVMYEANDHRGNIATCKFNVKVNDFIPPTVDRCYSPPPFVSSELYANITWEEPLFSDNSGERVRVERSHEPGYFAQGRTTVTYTAFDESGNDNTCEIVITIIPHPCQYPDPPVNGNRECHETIEGVHCKVTCKEGYAFAIQPAEDYFCAYDNTWRPEDKMPFPECSVKFISSDVHQPASITYLGSIECRRHSLLTEIEQTFQRKVTEKVISLCEEHFSCGVNNIGTTCEENEDFNTIRVVLGRNKRSANDDESLGKRSNSINIGPVKDVPKSSITFDFQIKGSVSRSGNVTADFRQQKALTSRLSAIMNTLKSEASVGGLDLEMNGKTIHVANMTFNKKGLKLNCKPGSVLVGLSCIQCPVGTYFDVVSKNCKGCMEGTYQPEEGQITCLVCPINTTTNHNNSKSEMECKALCLPGTFSPDGLERCATCPKGFYQNQYGEKLCIQCPPNTSTKRRGSRQKSKCKALCSPGYVSKSGLEPCYSCPRGTYQPELGQSSCYQCPGSGLTPGFASVRLTDCEGDWDMQADAADDLSQAPIEVNDCFENKCQNGAICEPKEFGFDCKCSPGFEGIYCETATDECEGNPCLNGGSCTDLVAEYSCRCADGFAGKKCEVNIDECATDPCENNGTCVDQINGFTCTCAPGYTGVTCTELQNHCEADPCENRGVCESNIDGYICKCTSGFTGVNCEINEDECQSSPCRNGAACIDGDATFSCTCKPGYEGKTCEIDIDECATSPCTNNATCQDQPNGFICHCPSGYAGSICDEELEVNYLLDFPSASVHNYSQMTVDKDLTALTVSFWMKTLDSSSQGTPFSYSSGELHNAFTLTNYEGFVFYINNKKQNTDVEANDGHWHHIVVTWSSNRGTWKIYDDGNLWDQGYNLAAGETIKGGGTFVVGQEQDPTGFSPSESFVGKLTQLNVWSEELPLAQIENLRLSCDKAFGDVVAWPDVQSGLRGSITTEPANFCRDCPVPTEPTYGKTQYSSTAPGSTVKYSCLRGFDVSGRNRRQCLVTGEWEGHDTPTCQRVNCGFPGPVTNGYVNARTFEYDNIVSYKCYGGYKLVGNGTLYCNADGIWIGKKPRCEEITCELPLLSENTILLSSSKTRYSARETAYFTCTSGNSLYTDHNSVTCQKDGTWNRSVPTCDPQTCKAPQEIDHGEPDELLEEYSVGYFLTYTCDFGYRLSQTNLNGQIQCLPTGEWDSNIPECVIKTCRPPSNITHGRVSYGETTFLSRAIYTCDPGYEIDGEPVLECLDTDYWDPRPPVCNPIDCGEPDESLNAIIKADSFSFSNVATYQCNGGYQLIGTERRTCLQNGSWSGTPPTCNPVSCGQPESIENGRFIGGDFTYRRSVTYECNEGYVISGVTVRTCRQDGRWTAQIPNCRRQKCPSPPKINNGFFITKEYLFGDSFAYQCLPGYLINGSNKNMTCQSDGSWTAVQISCIPIECHSLEPLEDGTVNALGLTFTSKAEYECDQGYELVGEAVRTCQADGSWSGNAAICRARKCSPPSPIENGQVDFKELKLNSVVLYFCKSGYKMVGEDVRRCLRNLTWSGDEPRCLPTSCHEPEDIENGIKLIGGLTFQSVVTYQCHEGYSMTGSPNITCTETRRWSGSVPICQRVVCETPSTITSNGRMFGRNFTYGGVIHYKCDAGYNLNGATNRTCLANGQWDYPIPICEVVRCPMPTLPNGSPSGFRNEYNTRITFSCRGKYVLFGPSERLCLANGSWSGPDPVCVKCRKLPTISNGSVKIFNGIATYKCTSGYYLLGAEQMHCQIDGSWTPSTPPVCKLRKCADLNVENFTNGVVTVTSQTAGSVAEYSCETGYTIVGTSNRICLSNGIWSGNAPVCVIRRCSGTFTIQNGQIQGLNNTYGSNLTFVCSDGYVMEGNSYVTCLEDGSWSGEAPICQITCPVPEEIAEGNVVVDGVLPGNITRYTCKSGFEMNGEDTRICLVTGEWSGLTPSCVRISCPPPVPLLNGQITGDKYHIGSEIHYRCNNGYLLEGIPFRLCLGSEKWTGSPPVCNKVRCRNPRGPRNGHIVGKKSEYYFEDTIDIVCNEGFNLTRGERTRRCLATRRWSLPFPLCTAIDCGEPPSKPNSHTRLLNGSTTFGNMFSITCDEGFSDVHSSVVYSTCKNNGKWSRFSIECSQIQCNTMPVIKNSNVEGDGFFYADVITVVCNPGFILTGDRKLTCKGDGTWTAANFPSCNDRISCGQPPDLENGKILGSDFTFGSIVSYECDSGFFISGIETRTCDSNGVWSGNAPTCSLIVCPEPPYVFKGMMITEKNQFIVGDTALYKCNPGYSLVGSNEMVCDENAFWTGTLPQCDRITCFIPEEIHNGRRTYLDLYYQSRVTYTCDVGFDLIGESVLTCLASGVWDHNFPECRPKDCGEPNFVANSGILGGLYTFGNVITYFCEDGYSLVGIDVLACTENGRWSSEPPQCVPISCGPPPDIPNAIRNGDSFRFKDQVFYICHNGFELSGNNVLSCADSSLWIGDHPVCDPVNCGYPPVIPFSTTLVTTTTFGSVITYDCNDGYRLQGDPMAACAEDGTWSRDDNVACIPLDCGPPPSFPHVHVNVTLTTYPSTVTYNCNTGYTLVGQGTLRCNERGVWEGSESSCVRQTCGPPPRAHSRVIVVGGDYFVGQTVSYKCPDGYIIVGNASSTCQSSGVWSSLSPDCEAAVCEALNLGDNLISEENIHDQQQVDFRCEDGYALTGQSSLRCTSTGDWSGDVPICTLINIEVCPELSAIPNGLAVPPARTVGQTATVQCITGYQAAGNMQVTCLSTNTWSKFTGRCQRTRCGKPRVTDMVNVIRIRGRSDLYGSKVRFWCRPGIRPIKIPPILTCLASGRWDGEIACALPCKGGCRNGGICLGLNGCKCPEGYGGRRCEKAKCILPCLHGGRCTAPYRCSCRVGYQGVRCQKPICRRPCENGGRCIKPNRCHCPHGYKPPFCMSGTKHRRIPPIEHHTIAPMHPETPKPTVPATTTTTTIPTTVVHTTAVPTTTATTVPTTMIPTEEELLPPPPFAK